jgi:hypothetical protein
MAKGDYSGPKYGGSRSGWEKGQKDAKKEYLLFTAVAVVGTILISIFFGNSKK